MGDQRSSKRGGLYWDDGTPYVSVTQAIDVLSKPGLQYWYGQQIYRAVVADPSINEKEAMSAPYQTGDKAKARGSAVHSIMEVWKAGTDYETFLKTVAEPYKGYATGFWEWVKRYQPEILSQERTVFSRKHGYAGTYDMLAKIDGKVVLVDLKTSAAVYPEYWYQLSAYKQALKENGVEVDEMAILLVDEEGGYIYKASAADKFRQFFACLVLWLDRNAEMLEQLGQIATRRQKKEAPNGQVEIQL